MAEPASRHARPVNIIGESKLARLGPARPGDLTVSVDDARLLPGLRPRRPRTRPLRVLVDCDTGLGRTGVATPEAAAELADAIDAREGLASTACSPTRHHRGRPTFFDEAIAHRGADGSSRGRLGGWHAGDVGVRGARPP